MLDEKNNRIYVVNEEGNSVTVFRQYPRTGILTKMQELSTLPDTATCTNKCADIHFSPGGKFLYASNRGHNSIAVYEIEAVQHTLILRGIYQTISKPRSFAFTSTGNYLIASDEAGTQVAIHKVDKRSGALSEMKMITVGEQPFWILTQKMN